MPFKLHAHRRHHIPKQKHKVTNWGDHDANLRQRGSLTVWFTDEAIATWKAEPRVTRGGQPRYSGLAIATALTLRAVFHLALRQTEGLIGSIIALLGLPLAVPDHSPLSRRAEALEVPQVRPGAGPVHLLVDSTGLRLCGAGEWLVEKHGTKPRRSWRKLHIGTDADTGRIVAAALTGCDVDDASQVGPLLDQVAGSVASFTADSACDIAGTEPRQRDCHLHSIRAQGRMAWQKASGYNWRGLVEADASRFKRVIGDGLRSRTDRRRTTEVAVAVRALNRMLDLERPDYVRIA